MSGNSKKELRLQYRQMRSQIPLQKAHNLLVQIMQHIEKMPWPSGKWLMSYKANIAKHEIPMPYLEDVITHYTSGMQFCYPRTHIADASMDAIADDAHVSWEPSLFGIMEPADGNVVPPQDIALILVPLLCFDKQGFRVGYGKGFYDRFLKRCSPNVITVGFSWFPPIDAIEDIDSNDVPLKYCITPHQLYVF